MKKIIAIIRDECVEQTKAALENIGVRGVTFLHVIGRGQQKGTIRVTDPEGTLRRNIGVYLLHHRGLIPDTDKPEYHTPVEKEIEFGFLPKRMLIIVASDDDVRSIVQTIITANQSGHHGDGKIFVCPMVTAIRVRTGEQGDKALS
jgi:nitrogen regulatory protein PII 2